MTASQPSVNNADKISSQSEASQNYGTNASNTKSIKCWQIEYYQPYFNVDTISLLQRLKRSLLPLQPFLDKELNEEPDLLRVHLFIYLFIEFILAPPQNRKDKESYLCFVFLFCFCFLF